MTDSREVIASALALAAERVTGDDLQAKVARRRHINMLTKAIITGGDSMPSRQELAGALGDPDDAVIRHALDDLTGQEEGE
jgi:hypothetical protein